MRWTAEDFTRATDTLAARLEKKRFLHTLGVTQTALTLAQRHGVNIERVAVAALLHDCAKGQESRELMERWCETFGSHPYTESTMPQLWHAPAGAWLAHTEFGVEDPEILDAIAWHPTGHRDPSPTLLILLAADYCEPSRDFPGVDEIRELVRQDLLGGVRELLERKVRYVENTGRELHPATRATLESLSAPVASANGKVLLRASM